MKALAIAATGMSSQQTNVEVIANNVANMNTTAYKRARAEFTDLIYQVDRPAGVPTQGTESPVPEGVRQGLGVRTAAVRTVHVQGALAQTSNRYDLAIDGRGWFQISGPDGEVLYTRAGAFNTNAEGQIVTLDGYQLEPAIVVPTNATDVTINESGRVYAKVDGTAAPREIGQITLTTFVNDAGLEPIGSNLFRESVASGRGVTGNPAQQGIGRIRQGFKEGSNVDPVKEITDLIMAQRSYELNSKIIQAADDMAGVVSKGLR